MLSRNLLDYCTVFFCVARTGYVLNMAALNIMFQPAAGGCHSRARYALAVDGFIAAVEAEKITAAFMVPTQANALCTLPDLENKKLCSWTKLAFAGAPMPDWVQLELMRRLPGLQLTQIYGQSEMGVIAALPPVDLPAKLARLKRPRVVKFVDGFPKTPIGKIQKNLLKKSYWLDRKKI